MQNKPNCPDAQMNVTTNITKDYEKKSNPALGENKPNSKPNKANVKKAKIGATICATGSYQNKPLQSLPQNKPKQSQIQNVEKLLALKSVVAIIIALE